MTGIALGGVKARLVALERKIRDARGACEKDSLIGKELGRLKSIMCTVESRCRDQRAIADHLVADTAVGRKHQLVATLAVAEERARDFVTELEYLRGLLPEVQAALWAAEKAAKDTAAEI